MKGLFTPKAQKLCAVKIGTIKFNQKKSAARKQYTEEKSTKIQMLL